MAEPNPTCGGVVPGKDLTDTVTWPWVPSGTREVLASVKRYLSVEPACIRRSTSPFTEPEEMASEPEALFVTPIAFAPVVRTPLVSVNVPLT